VGLHCEPLPASTSFGYFRQGQSNRRSIPAGNGATGASGTGPALGYLLNLLWFNSLFMLISENNMNTCTYLVHTLSLIYIMKLILIFGIKIYRKLPKCLTGTPRGAAAASPRRAAGLMQRRRRRTVVVLAATGHLGHRCIIL